MATNYTIKEAVKIIAEGKDMEQLADIGKRFPVLAHKIAVVAAKAGEDFVGLMNFMPDYLTANKVNSAIKAVIAGASTESDEDTDGEETEGTNETTSKDYDSMTGKELWELTGKLGIRKSLKSNKKADLIEALKAYDAGKLDDTDEDVDDEGMDDEATEENAYEGKSAMELFKECKKRGIKAAPKKPAKFYADLLIKDDEAAEEVEDSDDDWGDEETEAPKKEDKKSTKKPDKKPAKKAKEEDEDDDWDI